MVEEWATLYGIMTCAKEKTLKDARNGVLFITLNVKKGSITLGAVYVHLIAQQVRSISEFLARRTLMAEAGEKSSLVRKVSKCQALSAILLASKAITEAALYVGSSVLPASTHVGLSVPTLLTLALIVSNL